MSKGSTLSAPSAGRRARASTGASLRRRAGRFGRACAALLLAGVVAGCLNIGGGPPTPDAVIAPPPVGQAADTVIGDGERQVAMLLPLSAGGSAASLAQAFKNAATMALEEAGEDAISITVYDTAGASETAAIASTAALDGGAGLILGPVFAPAVSGAAAPARQRAVPVIAFSTDASVAGSGVYLLSFLPRQDARRIVSYAAGEGITTFAGLVPDDGYGLVIEAAFREAVAARGGRVTTVARYAPDAPEALEAAVAQLSGAGAFEALFVPAGGDDPSRAAAALSRAGLSARLLGSGQWGNPAVYSAPALQGAWFVGPSRAGFSGFAERYQTRFGAPPPRTASLVYDAVLLANGLARTEGDAGFSATSLEGRDGFLGVDGIFRLPRDGLAERGLAIYEVTGPQEAREVAPAPNKFTQGF